LPSTALRALASAPPMWSAGIGPSRKTHSAETASRALSQPGSAIWRRITAALVAVPCRQSMRSGRRGGSGPGSLESSTGGVGAEWSDWARWAGCVSGRGGGPAASGGGGCCSRGGGGSAFLFILPPQAPTLFPSTPATRAVSAPRVGCSIIRLVGRVAAAAESPRREMSSALSAADPRESSPELSRSSSKSRRGADASP